VKRWIEAAEKLAPVIRIFSGIKTYGTFREQVLD
jgi:hypothetical protein